MHHFLTSPYFLRSLCSLCPVSSVVNLSLRFLLHCFGVFKYATTNSTPNKKSVPPNTISDPRILPCITSTPTAIAQLNFSTMLGIIISRNLTGSLAITRNAICHANATPTNP